MLTLPSSSPCLGLAAPNRRSPLGSEHHLGRFYRSQIIFNANANDQKIKQTVAECSKTFHLTVDIEAQR